MKTGVFFTVYDNNRSHRRLFNIPDNLINDFRVKKKYDFGQNDLLKNDDMRVYRTSILFTESNAIL